MQRLLWFSLGAGTVCLLLAGAGVLILNQAAGFSARAEPTAQERWLAGWARGAALSEEARRLKNPVLNDFVTLVEARVHWADHCAGCHANDGSGDTEMGKSTYPPAPDMRLAATQDLTDGELFYVIQKGIRMTAMPAWGSPGGSDHNTQDSWRLVHFIRHLPFLTKEEILEMEKLNPRSAAEWKEEQDEERFLRGEDVENVNEPLQSHTH